MRYDTDQIPYAKSSLVARVSLSFGAVLLASIIMNAPRFLDPGFDRLDLISFATGTLVLWVLCFLPMVALVDERNRIFAIGRFPLIGAGLILACNVIISSMTYSRVVLTLHLARPAITGLIAGAAYALALRWLRNRTASTIEARHVPWT